jgi:hypothetical protein
MNEIVIEGEELGKGKAIISFMSPESSGLYSPRYNAPGPSPVQTD